MMHEPRPKNARNLAEHLRKQRKVWQRQEEARYSKLSREEKDRERMRMQQMIIVTIGPGRMKRRVRRGKPLGTMMKDYLIALRIVNSINRARSWMRNHAEKRARWQKRRDARRADSMRQRVAHPMKRVVPA